MFDHLQGLTSLQREFLVTFLTKCGVKWSENSQKWTLFILVSTDYVLVNCRLWSFFNPVYFHFQKSEGSTIFFKHFTYYITFVYFSGGILHNHIASKLPSAEIIQKEKNNFASGVWHYFQLKQTKSLKMNALKLFLHEDFKDFVYTRWEMIGQLYSLVKMFQCITVICPRGHVDMLIVFISGIFKLCCHAGALLCTCECVFLFIFSR